MSDSTAKPLADQVGPSPGSDDGADSARRRLLRAAAAAPFLATLPSGAALANASAFQCVVSSKESSDAGTPLLSRTGRDLWVRRAVTSRRFRSTQHGFAEVKDGWLIGSDWYDAHGIVFYPNLSGVCSISTEWCPVGTPTTAYVLQIYQPAPDPAGADPTGVTFIGIYPQYSIPSNRSSQVNNMGILGSCMCSVSPGFDQSAIYCHV